MYSKNSIRLIYLIFNLLSLSLIWILSFSIRFNLIFPIEKGVPSLFLYLKLLPFICLSWGFSFLVLSPEKRTQDRILTFTEVLWLVRVCLLSTLIFLGLSYFYSEYRYSRLTLLLFFFLHIIGTFLTTAALNYFFSSFQKTPSQGAF